MGINVLFLTLFSISLYFIEAKIKIKNKSKSSKTSNLNKNKYTSSVSNRKKSLKQDSLDFIGQPNQGPVVALDLDEAPINPKIEKVEEKKIIIKSENSAHEKHENKSVEIKLKNHNNDVPVNITWKIPSNNIEENSHIDKITVEVPIVKVTANNDTSIIIPVSINNNTNNFDNQTNKNNNTNTEE